MLLLYFHFNVVFSLVCLQVPLHIATTSSSSSLINIFNINFFFQNFDLDGNRYAAHTHYYYYYYYSFSYLFEFCQNKPNPPLKGTYTAMLFITIGIDLLWHL